MAKVDAPLAERLAGLVLQSLSREFPNKPSVVLAGPEDLRLPSESTPSFYGCFDWHSAVHMHWSLVRLVRIYPQAAFVPEATRALTASLSDDKLQAELRFRLRHPEHELPYGVAWLLTLQAELEQVLPAQAAAMHPLSALASEHFTRWLRRLPCPIRAGEHSQSAFSMGLIHDAAQPLGDDALQELVEERARAFYLSDRLAPIAYEPSAHDFLSPCLAEAELLARVLAPEEFVEWFTAFLPSVDFLPAATVDRENGKLAHWDGLNLSRSWMLRRIARALPVTDARRSELKEQADQHLASGLEGLNSDHYAASHWLTSFALYALGARW